MPLEHDVAVRLVRADRAASLLFAANRLASTMMMMSDISRCDLELIITTTWVDHAHLQGNSWSWSEGNEMLSPFYNHPHYVVPLLQMDVSCRRWMIYKEIENHLRGNFMASPWQPNKKLIWFCPCKTCLLVLLLFYLIEGMWGWLIKLIKITFCTLLSIIWN